MGKVSIHKKAEFSPNDEALFDKIQKAVYAMYAQEAEKVSQRLTGLRKEVTGFESPILRRSSQEILRVVEGKFDDWTDSLVEVTKDIRRSAR